MAENDAQGAPADGYAAALAELQKILDALAAPDVDVDARAAHVDRAAELLRFCRQRLVAAEMQVTEIVAGLDDLSLDADSAETVPDNGAASAQDDPAGGADARTD